MTVVVKRSSIDPQVRTIIVAGGTYRQVALEHLSRLTRTVLASYRLDKDASQEIAYEQQVGHRLELGADFSALKERAEAYLSDYEHEVGKTAFLSAAKETLGLAMDPVAPLQLVLDAHIRAIHEATPPRGHTWAFSRQRFCRSWFPCNSYSRQPWRRVASCGDGTHC